MKSELEILQEENAHLRGMLEFERNKYERQMILAESEISDQLAKELHLELQAIRETAEYVAEADRRRICRRLDRIERVLLEMKSKSQAALQKYSTTRRNSYES